MKRRHRLTSRILIFDENDRVLLFLTRGRFSGEVDRWLTPGGGVEKGETHAEGAIRELFEETGLQISDPGEPVWSLDFAVDYIGADHDSGHAEYFLLRTPNFVPSDAGWTPEELTDILEHRWWSIDELLKTSEPYEPDELPDVARKQLEGF